MFADLSRQDVARGDFAFFAAGVAGQADDFHAVQERRRDVQGVGGRDEEHPGEVNVGFEVVIAEGVVLRGIEDFEQGGGRVAAVVHADFVDFVQQDERVVASQFAQFLYDFAG